MFLANSLHEAELATFEKKSEPKFDLCLFSLQGTVGGGGGWVLVRGGRRKEFCRLSIPGCLFFFLNILHCYWFSHLR